MDRLLDLLRERSFSRKSVVLASGRESDFFIDCKQTVLLAEGHVLYAERCLAIIQAISPRPRAVAGVELGGCPLASAVALISHQRSHQRGDALDAIYVRKQAKDHGSRRALEGDGHLPSAARVIVLEDVITTGASTRFAVQQLRAAGYRVEHVIALVDREEGGRQALEATGLQVTAMYRKRDFMEPDTDPNPERA